MDFIKIALHEKLMQSYFCKFQKETCCDKRYSLGWGIQAASPARKAGVNSNRQALAPRAENLEQS
jgi:hypothetical protein